MTAMIGKPPSHINMPRPATYGAGVRLQQVTAVKQDVADMDVFAGAHAQRHRASRFQPNVAVTLAQIQQTLAGTVGMLGVASALKHLCHHVDAGHAGARTPGHQPVGRPLSLVLVAPGRCSNTVVKPPLYAQRRWLATRSPRCKTSTAWAVTRSSRAAPPGHGARCSGGL